ncbi:MAG: DUF488 family protein [Flavobacteriales bacterium]
MDIRIKRVYDEPSDDDGFRMLVDRLWPRGITKVRAHLDEWNKTVAPSPALRQKFHQGDMTFAVFAKAYRAELKELESDLDRIRAQAKKGPVTLLYGAKDPVHNHVVVLMQALRKHA